MNRYVVIVTEDCGPASFCMPFDVAYPIVSGLSKDELVAGLKKWFDSVDESTPVFSIDHVWADTGLTLSWGSVAVAFDKGWMFTPPRVLTVDEWFAITREVS